MTKVKPEALPQVVELSEYPGDPSAHAYRVKSEPRRVRVPARWPHGRLLWLDEHHEYNGGWLDANPRDLDYEEVWAVDVEPVA